MASTVYEVLDVIERGRKHAIANAKIARLPANEDMDLFSLGDLFLQQNNPTFVVSEPWRRPYSWPDTKAILSSAEDRENLHPAYIVLFNDDYDTTLFTKNTAGRRYRYDAILTSDGEWIKQDNYLHTWDKSKDINTSEGYKVRWAIIYVANTTIAYGSNGVNVISLYEALGMIEFISGNITISGTGAQPITFSTGGYVEPTSSTDSSVRANGTIMNIEMPEQTLFSGNWNGIGIITNCYNLRNIYIHNVPYMTGYSNRGAFQGCPNFESIDFPSITGWGSTTGGGACCRALPKLRYVNMPSLQTLSPCSFYECPSLKNLYFPELRTMSKQAIVSCGIESFIAPLLSTFSTESCNNIGYNGTFVYCDELKSLSIPNLQIMPANTGFFRCRNLKEINLPRLQRIESTIAFCSLGLTSLVLTSNLEYSTTLALTECFSLKELVIPTDWDFNINVSQCPLTYESILEMFDCLKDNSESGYTRTLTLGTVNMSKLSNEDIEIATNKGWNVN